MTNKGNITEHDLKPVGPTFMLLLSFFVGIITGFGAIGFRFLIGLVHNILFYGVFDFAYNANNYSAPSAWGIWIIFAPAIGAIIVAWLIQTFAPTTRGSGVPEVMNSIYYKEGKIKPIVAVIKAIASSISIGSGGSVGREGPIIQIGSAFASTLGQIVNIPVRQKIVLIAAGAGAGIAATFNAPIGGLAFAAELMLVSINVTTLGIVAIATATATYIGRIFLGSMPALNIPTLESLHSSLVPFYVLLLFIPLGLLIGLASTLFIRSIYWFEDVFDNLSDNYYIKHVIGMLLVGVVFYVLMRYTGHYYVQGVGYATIINILKSLLTNPWLLLLLFVAKLLSTSLTLGSGAAGGIFSPSLYLGATLGAVYGILVHVLFPGLQINPVIFALGGMAGMVSASTGTLLTSIAMAFELTRDYNSILPVIIVVALASWLRKLLSHENIYTLNLLRRGIIVPKGLQAAITSANRARDIMTQTFQIIQLSDINEALPNIKSTHSTTIVEKHGKIMGILRHKPFLKTEINEKNLKEFIDQNYLLVSPFTDLVTITHKMQAKEADTILVTRKPQEHNTATLLGVITAKEISSTIGKTARLMS